MGATTNMRQLACTTCAKAKSRCLPSPTDSSKCERCTRLDKPCVSRSPAPPRPKTQFKRSRVAELEKRLTELSSHFQNGQRVVDGPSEPVGSSGTVDNQHVGGQEKSLQLQLQPEVGSEKGRAGSDESRTPEPGYGVRQIHLHVFPIMGDETESSSSWPTKEAVQASSSKSFTAIESSTPPPWPVGDEADAMLRRFHEVLAHLSPFVMVPRDLTSEQLRVRRPFLWKGVMLSCAFTNGQRQHVLGEQFLEEIGKAAMSVDGSRLDVLQGLLMVISWYHHTLRTTRTVNLLFLARSMCLTLNLSLGSKEPWLERGTEQDFDHLRAYAGTYYLNTVAFTTNKKVDVFMHTSYLESVCRVLETAQQTPSDMLLVQLVRVQQIAQSITHTVSMEPSQQAMQLPLMAVVESFQGQLDSLRQSLPADLQENAMLITHISITEVLLGEVGLSEIHCRHSNITPVDRLRILWFCARSLRAFFDIRCKEWAEVEHPRFLCMRGLDVTYALITGARLIAFKLPGWNLQQVEETLRYWEVTEWLVRFLDMMTKARRRHSDSGPSKTTFPSDPADEDSLERLLRVAMGLKEIVKGELDKIKQDSMATDEYYPSPKGDVGDVPFSEEYSQDLWKDMIDEGQWNMVGEFQWL